MNSNLNILAVQDSFSDLIKAVDNIKTDNDLILYTNITDRLQIGDNRVTSRRFNTVLYSEENDIIIMLMKNGQATADNMRLLLDSKNMRYNEVCFDYYDTFEDIEDEIPELFFARDMKSLEEAFEDSVKKNNNTCECFPTLLGRLYLDYQSTYNRNCYKIDGRFFRGVIEFNDKIILLVSTAYEKNFDFYQIIELAKKHNIICNILEDSKFNISKKPYIKKKNYQD